MLTRPGKPKLPPSTRGDYLHPHVADLVYECLTMEAWSDDRGAFIPTSWTIAALQKYIPVHSVRIDLTLRDIPGVITRKHRSGETLYKLATDIDRKWRGERVQTLTIQPA